MKKKILSLIACVFCLLLVLPMFLEILKYATGVGSLGTASEYTLFENLADMNASDKLSDFWFTLLQILGVATLATGVLYVVCEIGKLLSPKTKALNTLSLVFAVATLILGIVSIVDIVVICATLTYSQATLLGTAYYNVTPAIGAYFLMGASVFGGVFGLLAYLESPKTKGKRRRK